MPRLRIVYDGDCPFCSRYTRLLRLREAHDVELVDARQRPETARAYGLDLNEGMIADLDGRVHHGADAVWLLSRLSRRPGPLYWRPLSWRPLARLLYPAMRLGRRLTLHALRRRPL